MTSRVGRCAALASLVALALCSLARAAGPEATTPPVDDQAAGERAAIPCQCRYDGRAFELGERVCLNGPNGPRMARCDMAQNNTSWTFTDEPCPVSWRVPPSARASLAGARLVR